MAYLGAVLSSTYPTPKINETGPLPSRTGNDSALSESTEWLKVRIADPGHSPGFLSHDTLAVIR